MANLHRANLHPAFSWDCEECGELNFCRAITREVTDDATDEMQQAIRESCGLEDWEELPDCVAGLWLTIPNTVVCSRCGERYATKDSQAGGDSDE